MENLIRFGLLLLCVAPLYVISEYSCKDQPWCPSQKHLCKHKLYKGYMKEHCRKTCNFCHDGVPACEKAGCQHNCNVIDDEASCSCLPGYVLNHDRRSCTDINECLFESSCTDPLLPTCHNTEGSFVCTTCQGRPGQTTYYQSNKCCQKSDIRSCGQNSMTGVHTPPGPDNILGLWPWTTLMSIRGRACSGALVSPEWILAPAHCFSAMNGTADVVAQVGIRTTKQNNSGEIYVDRVVVHDDYDFPNNDIALVHLQRRVETSWATRSICLPNGEVPRDSARCWLSGFEAMYSSDGVYRRLEDSTMTIVSSSVCSEQLGRIGRRSHKNQTLCTRYERSSHPSCAAETGGPLVCQRCDSCDFFLAGMMTFGDRCVKESKSFAAFASVENFEQWISEVTHLPVSKDGSCRSTTSPRLASWQPWSRFSSCSRTCGGGWLTRSRVCINGETGDPGCRGDAEETSECNSQPCPRWGQYSRWSDCSSTCGEGSSTRTRTCINGSVRQQGCHEGSEEEVKPCRVKGCAYWGRWSQWSDCDHSCGREGIQFSSRECIGGETGEGSCPGEKYKWKPCNRNPCPAWSEWSPYSPCPATCGASVVRTSNRICLHGNGCQGPSHKSQPCGLPLCPDHSIGQRCLQNVDRRGGNFCRANSQWCGSYQYRPYMQTYCYRTCCLLGRL